jgi:hypothetical protein
MLTASETEFLQLMILAQKLPIKTLLLKDDCLLFGNQNVSVKFFCGYECLEIDVLDVEYSKDINPFNYLVKEVMMYSKIFGLDYNDITDLLEAKINIESIADLDFTEGVDVEEYTYDEVEICKRKFASIASFVEGAYHEFLRSS